MKLYRKNPQENEAVHVLDGMDNYPDEIIEWGNGKIALNPLNSRGLTVSTPSGPLNVDMGDWIVKGAPDDFYPVKDEKFRELYSIPEAKPLDDHQKEIDDRA